MTHLTFRTFSCCPVSWFGVQVSGSPPSEHFPSQLSLEEWVLPQPLTSIFFFFWLLPCFGRLFFKSWNDFLRRSLRRSSFWVTSHLSQNSPGPLSCLVYGSVQALVAMPRVQEWFAVCKWWQIFNILQVDRILLFLWERHVRMQCSQSLLSFTLPQLLLSIPNLSYNFTLLQQTGGSPISAASLCMDAGPSSGAWETYRVHIPD